MFIYISTVLNDSIFSTYATDPPPKFDCFFNYARCIRSSEKNGTNNRQKIGKYSVVYRPINSIKRFSRELPQYGKKQNAEAFFLIYLQNSFFCSPRHKNVTTMSKIPLKQQRTQQVLFPAGVYLVFF